MKKCWNIFTCAAPLCPMNEESLKYGRWFPDEEICKLRSVPDWVKRQRKIAKKVRDKSGFFEIHDAPIILWAGSPVLFCQLWEGGK